MVLWHIFHLSVASSKDTFGGSGNWASYWQRNIIWLNGWVFVYELSGCGFKSNCSHLNFIFCTCFDQGVPWHSGNCRVWIHSETRTWHDKNIQLIIMIYASWPTCTLPYASICFSFHDSMHLSYDVVRSFSLQRFAFFIFQYWFNL